MQKEQKNLTVHEQEEEFIKIAKKYNISPCRMAQREFRYKFTTYYQKFLEENEQRVDEILQRQIPDYYMLREENNIETQLEALLRFRIEHEPNREKSNAAAVSYAALAAQRESYPDPAFDSDYIFEIILQRNLFEALLARIDELEEDENSDDKDYLILDYMLRCLRAVYASENETEKQSQHSCDEK